MASAMRRGICVRSASTIMMNVGESGTTRSPSAIRRSHRLLTLRALASSSGKEQNMTEEQLRKLAYRWHILPDNIKIMMIMRGAGHKIRRFKRTPSYEEWYAGPWKFQFDLKNGDLFRLVDMETGTSYTENSVHTIQVYKKKANNDAFGVSEAGGDGGNVPVVSEDASGTQTG